MLFKLALRIFRKFLPVKIASVLILSVGMLFFLIASTIYVKDIEFNNKFPNADRIFRINTQLQFVSGATQTLSVSPALIGPYLKDALPEVTDEARLWKQASNTLKAGDQKFFGEDIVWVDSSFFNLFNFSVAHGSLSEIIDGRPDIAILTETMASRLFGKSNPIDKAIVVNETAYKVSAVIRESETDLDHAVFIPMPDDLYDFEWIETFVLLTQAENDASIKAKVNESLEMPMSGEYNMDVMKVSFEPVSLKAMRFQDALFSSATSNALFLYFLMAIAIVLMSLCCLSVLNFEGTISLNRIKEVSVRKIFGSNRYQILYQFMVENSVVFLFSIPIVLASFYSLLPDLNAAWSYKLTMRDIMHPYTITLLLIFITGYIFLMTLVNYRLYLRNGSIHRASRHQQPAFNGITRFLLPFQIFICVLVLCFTSLSSRQVRQMSGSDVGFSHEDVYIVDITGNDPENVAQYLQERLLQESGVSGIARVNKQSVPGRDAEVQLFNLNGADADKEIACQLLFIDENYFDLLDIDILSKNKAFEDGDLLVNSSLVKKQSIHIEEENTLNGITVAGEVASYYHDGLFATTKPMVFHYDESKLDALLVRLSPAVNQTVLQKLISDITSVEKLEVSVELSPLKDVYFSRQNSDYRLLDVITLCNYFIILITILGILSSTNMIYNMLMRQNLIRKIHGASNFQILKHSGKLIYLETLAAFVLSIALSHLIFFEWRSRYAVKVPMSIGSYFPLASFVVMAVIAFIFFFMIRMRKLKIADAL